MNKYTTSTGERISQATIHKRLSNAYREKHIGNGPVICECCRKNIAVDNSHIISQRRCKEMHKADLIYNPDNFMNSCRECHNIYESYKNGQWIRFENSDKILKFIRANDEETYQKMINL